MPAIPNPHDGNTPITVYITGFGVRPSVRSPHYKAALTPPQPFRKVTRNPSWEIVSSFLPSTRISSPSYAIDIVPHPDFVKVAYETVDTLIPQIHAKQTFDYILHVGVGLPGDYEIETVAHEKGYVKADVDGLIPGRVQADPEKESDGMGGDTGKDGVAVTDGGVVYRTDLGVGKICAMIEKAGIDVCVAL